MDDSSIVQLYWQRDEKAIEASEEKYGGYCHKIAWNILQSKEDAEECVADTWMGAWRAMPPHRPQRLATFLGKITRNLSCNRLNAQMAVKRGGGEITLVLDELLECIPASNTVEKTIEDEQLGQAMNTFLYTLPERECNVFLRRYWYVESFEEIANRYHLKAGNVKMIVSRVRRKLRNYLEKEGFTL